MPISEDRKWVEHASGPYGLLKLRLLETAAVVVAFLTVASLTWKLYAIPVQGSSMTWRIGTCTVIFRWEDTFVSQFLKLDDPSAAWPWLMVVTLLMLVVVSSVRYQRRVALKVAPLFKLIDRESDE